MPAVRSSPTFVGIAKTVGLALCPHRLIRRTNQHSTNKCRFRTTVKVFRWRPSLFFLKEWDYYTSYSKSHLLVCTYVVFPIGICVGYGEWGNTWTYCKDCILQDWDHSYKHFERVWRRSSWSYPCAVAGKRNSHCRALALRDPSHSEGYIPHTFPSYYSSDHSGCNTCTRGTRQWGRQRGRSWWFDESLKICWKACMKNWK